MSSPRTLDFAKRTTRHGIQALYTFTPFKLIFKGDKVYELILTETSHHEANVNWHSKSVKDKFVSIVSPGFSKNVVQPYELYITRLTSGQTERYVFKPKGRMQWRYFPEYMEFSWEALRDGYYCTFGWVLLSSKKDNCPIANDCPYREGDRCRYYLGPIAYSSLYNVYPLINKKYEPPTDKSLYEPLAAIRYKSMPLVTLTYIPNGSYIAFINGVQFSPKRARVFRPPILFLKEGLGFRILQAPAIQFEFNKDTLRELIQERLNSNPTLARWIKLKQQLYLHTDNDGLIRNGNGFDAFQQLANVVKLALSKNDDGSVQKIVKDINQVKVDDNLVNFASVLFVHSFTHLFLNWISARYGYGKGDFGYHLEHDRIQQMGQEGVRAFVFEMAIGGLGYLKSFAQDIANKNILSEFIGSENKGIQTVLKFCEERSTQALKDLPMELKRFSSNEQATNAIISAILKIYTKSFSDPCVYPHVNSVREAIINTVNMNMTDTRDLIDDLLARVPHCWDGCQLCVMLERGCNYSPFDQPFLVTSRLTRDIIRIIKKMIDSPMEVFPLKVGVYEEFQRFVSTARYTIDLVSPWLSPDVVKILAEKAEENELRIRIITTNDMTNKTHGESLMVLKDKRDCIKVNIARQIHAKGMLVDGVMLLTGTFNFTRSGLTSNKENLVVDFSLKGTKYFKSKFDDIWANSSPLDQIM